MKIKDLTWLEDIFNNINLKNLPHGVIITGPEGLGKKLLAKEIATKLLLNKNSNEANIDLIDSENHPDLFLINKEKILLRHITFRKNKWDDEKGYRNVNDFLSITPSIAQNKVAIILNAQTMNDESQNALLKSLEEPAPNTFIILTTNRPKSLLHNSLYSGKRISRPFGTVVCTCVRINISPFCHNCSHMDAPPMTIASIPLT